MFILEAALIILSIFVTLATFVTVTVILTNTLFGKKNDNKS